MSTAQPAPTVRPARAADLGALVAMRCALWPDGSADEHRDELRDLMAGRLSTLPVFVAVAEVDDALVGFVEAGLRSHADGCDPRRPVGFVEGWWVDPAWQRRGIGGALLAAAEVWARTQGCREMASDTWADALAAQRAHEALGYAPVDRCVNYRKVLVEPRSRDAASPRSPTPDPLYDAVLARLHHDHFGRVAEAAAALLLARANPPGRVVELAAGSGISSALLSAAGHVVTGVDIAPAMLAIAHEHAPNARFVEGSLWDHPLPSGLAAVTAIGEAMCYVAPGTEAQDRARLQTRLGEIHDALRPGGVFLADFAGPDRSGPHGERSGVWRRGGAMIALTEHAREGMLERRIDTIVGGEPARDGGSGSATRRFVETHRLVGFSSADVSGALRGAGFEQIEVLSGYAGFAFPAGWHGVLAVRA